MSYPGRSQGPAIVTPEAVPLDFELANIGSRSLALSLDVLIQGAALFAISIGLTASLAGSDLSGGVVVALFFILYFLVLFGYPVALETLWRGRTVGKAAMGLRVVTKEGAPIRFRHAAIRAALGLVDFWLTSGAGAVIAVLCTRDNQRLGDLVAGTIVLRERSGLKAPAPVGFYVPAGMESYAAALDVAGLSAEDYQAARAFLTRAPSLPYQVRADLAVQLANPLAARVRPAPPPGTVPEAFVACVAAAYQQRAALAGGFAAPGGAPGGAFGHAGGPPAAGFAGPPPAPRPPPPSPPPPPPPPEPGNAASEPEPGFAPPA